MPDTYGFELSPGDDLGRNVTPTCCGTDMAVKDAPDGDREYTCGECDTELTVSPNGLVFDITG